MKFDYNNLIGRYYGYPSCCTKEFSLNGEPKVKNKKYITLFGTGFIPCQSCNKIDPDELIKIIKSNRTCKLEFPEAHSIKDPSFIEDIKTSKFFNQSEIRFLIKIIK